MIPHELLLVLLGVAIGGMWAVSERSLRRSTEESRERILKELDWWRNYKLQREKEIRTTAAARKSLRTRKQTKTAKR